MTISHKYLIGIDPGVNTGFAVYDTEKKQLIECKTIDFWSAISWVQTFSSEEIKVFVEMPKTKAVWHRGAKNEATKNRTAVNVGSVIREAELIIEMLERLGADYCIVAPKGKVLAAPFSRITGWTGRSSQHARDAAMLLF